MSSFTPITLVGNNLGERHRYLNSLVSAAHKQNVPFESILDLPENSPVDKLFKIDLASKYRNLDYIMKVLTNEDMLYVSRGLKSLWLLEPHYSGIINPTYLEGVLYPSMATTAVNKMRHWLQLHLRGEERCKIFYEYYNKTNFKLAIHFLAHCSSAFILLEVNNVLDKLTPHYMKLLGEKCPSVAKIYYDSLQSRPSYINYYRTHEKEFFCSLKCLLKVDHEMVLDVVEKYFRLHSYSPFNAQATKYILKNSKNRFINKMELYTTRFLNKKTLAKYLSSEEIKEIILKIARANYLCYQITYKRMEPLIKRINREERKAFKKQVFVDKHFGDKVKEWPYEPPVVLDWKYSNYEYEVFKDKQYYPGDYQNRVRRRLILRRCKRIPMHFCSSKISRKCGKKTLLDRLFNEYRFVGFKKTMYELRKRITAESSSRNREYILLVLVSKTGGRIEFLFQLLQLLVEKCINEPPTVRATVARSLVKRTTIWRLPDEAWNMFLKFSHGLGLDGAQPEAACNEGIHAVVLRDIIHNKDPSVVMFGAFLSCFTSFSDYSLNKTERNLVLERLPRLIIPSSEENCEQAVERLKILLDFSKSHNLPFDMYSDATKAVKALAHRNLEATQTLLQSLFNSRIMRKHFFMENFKFIQTDDSYVNALRHDISFLVSCEKFENIIENDVLKHDKFLQKLALYFNENDGLAARYLAVLENRVLVKPNIKLARSIAILAGNSVWERINVLKSIKTRESKLFATALLDNVHLSRPLWNLQTIEWRLAGVKAIANKVFVCNTNSATDNLHRLLGWKKTARVALVLSERVGKEALVFQTVAATKPIVALKAAMKYFTRRQETINPGVWLAVKSIIPIYVNKRSRCKMFKHIDKIPSAIKTDYCVSVYNVFNKFYEQKAIKVLFIVESLFPKIEETFISNVIEKFISEDLSAEKMSKADYYFEKCIDLYLRVTVKFLLYCKTEDVQRRKIETVVEPFFERLECLWGTKTQVIETNLTTIINDIISAMKYNTVYFDNECVSLMPVFERVVQKLQRFLPLNRYFDIYMKMHLTMYYYKSVRQSVDYYPEIFEDGKRMLQEGVDIVGKVFGKYIAEDINELMDRYYLSIKEIYKVVLLNYITGFGCYGEKQIGMSVVKGIVESKKHRALPIAEYIFHSYVTRHGKKNQDNSIEMLKESDDLETKFLLYADVY